MKALINPQRSLNPVTKSAAKPKIIALTIRENKPKVIIVNGKVKTSKTGFTTAFRRPKTMAETTAFPTLSISTPVGSLEIISKLIEWQLG